MPKWQDLFGSTRGSKCDLIKINVSSLVVLILLVQVIPLYAHNQQVVVNNGLFS
jgi:hypothetical protein